MTLAIVAATAVQAAPIAFAIPPTTLGAAIILLGEQAGLTIGFNEPGVAARRTAGVHGRMTTRAALDKLLAGTGYNYVFVDSRTVRISKAAPSPTPVAIPAATVAADPAAARDIVVTGSKQGLSMARFPGAVSVIALDDARGLRDAAKGTQGIVDRLPQLFTTGLGSGRDKLFIRGVADSSFNGTSQSTVGQYLGDVRLNFNAPDPDLNLYDIARVEVLEGPQGTLYGTGSLGGILRLVPNAPDLDTLTATAHAAWLSTHLGATGSDLAAMVNVPLAAGKVALRGVGWRVITPGYIDDSARNLTDINRTSNFGGRLTLRYVPGDDWTIDLGVVVQNIQSSDGQYAETNLPPLTRRSLLAQPFDNDYRLAYVRVIKAWDVNVLTSTTNVIRQTLVNSFDASGYPGTTGATLFRENVTITLFSHETRVAGQSDHANWLAGFSAIQSDDLIQRSLSNAALTPLLAGARNVATEAAVFGQYGWHLRDSLTLTGGARLAFAQGSGERVDALAASDGTHSSSKLLPMAAVSWQARPSLVAFAQIQQGARAGGVTTAIADVDVLPQHFDPDQITTFETGVRFGSAHGTGVHGTLSAALSRWTNIQSDLVDITGLPFTTNIGDGKIAALETQLSWSPTDGLTLEASGFLNNSVLDKPAPLYAAAVDRELPNVAEMGGRVAFQYYVALSADISATFDGAVRYVGTSTLGIGPLLDVTQGDYAEASLGARVDRGNWGLTLGIDNLTDTRGNRFSFGDPFGLIRGNQITPLRPRTVRIGADAHF